MMSRGQYHPIITFLFSAIVPALFLNLGGIADASATSANNSIKRLKSQTACFDQIDKSVLVENQLFVVIQNTIQKGTVNELKIAKNLLNIPIPLFLKKLLTNYLSIEIQRYKWLYGKDWKTIAMDHLGSPQIFSNLHAKYKQVYQNDRQAGANHVSEILESHGLSTANKWYIIDAVIRYQSIPAWPNGPLLDPISQLLIFETQANQFASRTSLPLPFDIKTPPIQSVVVTLTENVPAQIIETFQLQSLNLRIPVSPIQFTELNGADSQLISVSQKLPFHYLPTVGQMPGYLTASRSTFFEGISIKIPVLNASSDGGLGGPKIFVKEDAQDSLRRTKLINSVDSYLKKDSRLILLKDVASVYDPKTDNSLLFRDTTPLFDGHYYMPAFSVWEIGNHIAQQAGQSFNSFWMEHFARAFGRAKAIKLVRYGLLGVNPHEQQWLIQLSKLPNNELVPTGNIVIRDLTDTVFFLPFLKIINSEQVANESRDDLRENFDDLGMYQLVGNFEINQREWLHEHHLAFKETIEELLGVSLGESWRDAEKNMSAPHVLAALRRFHQTNRSNF